MHDHGLLSPVRAGQHIASLLGDDAWIAAMLEVEVALARTQARVGMIPVAAAQTIAAAVQQHRFDAADLAVASRGAANPVVSLVEELTRAVAHLDPSHADHVHRGSTSQDILDTASMLLASRALAVILRDLDSIAVELAELAARHRDTPIAARTLGMHAVPTTFGLKAASWLNAIVDAIDRLASQAHGGLPVQLGGAAGTLAAYLECASAAGCADPHIVPAALSAGLATELGLSAPEVPWHTNRRVIIDIAGALALASGALGKLALDILDLSRTEIGEVREPAAHGRGQSSAMPQKRNPTLSTLVRSAALQVPALVSILHHSMLAEHERPAGAWHSEWQPLRDCLVLVGAAAATTTELLDGLVVDTAQMRRNLDLTAGQIVSERLSTALTPLLGKTAAKNALRTAAFEAEHTRRPMVDILAENSDVRAHFDHDAITALLLPDNYLGAAAALVDTILARHARTTLRVTTA